MAGSAQDPRDEEFGGYARMAEAVGSGDFAKDGGEVLPIVTERPSRPNLTKEQQDQLFEVYKVVAREMPLEGRDFRIEFGPNPTDPSRVSLSLVPLNEFGGVWCRHLAARLSEEFGKDRNQNAKTKEQDQ